MPSTITTLNGTVTLGNATFSGPGTLEVLGLATLYGYNLTNGGELLDDGTILQQGNLQLGLSGTDSGFLTIARHAVYEVLTQSNIYADGTAAVFNDGVFAQIDGDAGIDIYADFTNASHGTLNTGADDPDSISLLGSNNELAGTVDGNELYLNNGMTTLEAGLVLATSELELGADGTLLFESNRVIAGEFNDPLQVGPAGLDLNGHQVTLAGSGADRGTEYGGGTLDIAGTFYIGGGAPASGTELLVTGLAIQDGEVRLDYDNGTAAAILSIAAGATYDITVDYWLDNNQNTLGTGLVINAGLLEKTGGVGNTDVFNAPGNSNIWPDFTNASTGTIYIGTDLQLSVRGSTNALAGIITGPGTLLIGQGGVTTLEAGLSLGVGSLILSDYETDVLMTSSRTYAGQFIVQNSATLELQGQTLDLTGTAGLYAPVAGAGLLDISGQGDISGLVLTGGDTLEDAGTIIQNGAFQLSNGATDSASLFIASGAVFNIISDNAVQTDGTAAITNAGLFEKTADINYNGDQSEIYPAFTNAASGTIAALSGELIFGDLVNDGQITIANAELLTNGDVAADAGQTGTFVLGPGATLNEAGGLDASQTVVLTGTNDVVDLGGSASSAIFGFGAGDVIDVEDVPANGFFYGGNQITLTENGTAVDTIALVGITDPGDLGLVVDGRGGTDIVLGNPTQGTVTIDNWTVAGSGDLNAGGNWSSGVGPGALSVANIINDANGSVIYDSASSTIYDLNDGNGADTFAQTAGTLVLVDGGFPVLDEFDGFAGALDQSAGADIISQFGGNMRFGGGATVAGTLAGAGEIAFEAYSGNQTVTLMPSAVLAVGTLGIGDQDPDGTIALALGADIAYAGTLNVGNSGDGNLSNIELDGYTLALTGSAAFESGNLGAVTGPGELIVAGALDVGQYGFENGVTLDVTGELTDNYRLILGDSPSDTSLLTIASTGTFVLAAGASVIGQNDTSFTTLDSGPIINDGLFIAAGDGDESVIAYQNFTQSSKGTLDVASGVLDLNSPNGNTTQDLISGTVEGVGQIEFDRVSVTFEPHVALKVASVFLHDSSDATLAANLTYAGSIDFNPNNLYNSGEFSLNGFDLRLSGTANLGDEYLSGPGTLVVANQATLDGFDIGQGAELLDTGTITQTSHFVVGGDLSIAAGAILNMVSYDESQAINGFGSNGGTIVNAGLFEQTAIDRADGGDPGYVLNSVTIGVDSSFTQSSHGTLAVDTDTVEFQNNNQVFAGTITGDGVVEFNSGYNSPDNVTFAPNLALNIASLILNNAHGTLAGDLLDSGGFTIDNGGDLSLDRYDLTLANQAVLDGNVYGPGTLDITGTAFVDFNLDSGASLVTTGTIYVEGGDLDKASVLSGGDAVIEYGATASGTVLGKNGTQTVSAGATASATKVGDGGLEYVACGGLTENAIVKAHGSEDIYGSATGLMVSSGGKATVYAGGVAANATIAGGTLKFSAGGIVSGGLDFTGTGGDLIIESPVLPANTISGFAAGDTIQLAGITYVAGAHVTVGQAGVVTIIDGGHKYKLNIAGATVGETDFTFSSGSLLTKVPTPLAANFAAPSPAPNVAAPATINGAVSASLFSATHTPSSMHSSLPSHIGSSPSTAAAADLLTMVWRGGVEFPALDTLLRSPPL